MDDLYTVGTFCQITEVRELSDRIRLVLLGHRRISINDISQPDHEKKEGEEEAVAIDKIVQV